MGDDRQALVTATFRRLLERPQRVRHPVSSPESSGGDFRSAGVPLRIVGAAALPSAPEDTYPGAGEDADGVGVLAAAGAGLAVDGCRPSGGVAGGVGGGGGGSGPGLFSGPPG